MKKLTLTMLLFLGLGFSAMAQGGGLFEMGDTKSGGTRTTGTGLMLPEQHGMEGDQSATPLGTGTALLLGLGAAYAVARSRKNKSNKKNGLMIAAMLLFLAPAMTVMGQTRTTQTASYGFETGDVGWTATSFVTNNTAITAHGGSKYGATNGGSSADVKYNTIVASPQSLTCYYSKTTTNTNAGSKFLIQVSSNNSTWTTVATGLGMDQVTKGTWYELTADLSSYSNVYVRVRYDGTSAVRALDDITLTYDDGQSPSTDPEITFNPTSISLGEVLVGNQVTTTFSVSQANLTSGITLSVDNGSLSPSSIAQGAAATTVTWTYTPTTAGAISATVTATSGETTETLAISGTAIAPVEGYDVDFEYATNMYPNWTFDNMTTYQTGSITAHGGTYYGTTGGKATASITTTSTIANPGTLTCYVSKQSGNTTSSTWYIQVSEDGSTWTEVNTQSATSMAQGTWEEFTADLNNYTNVYVRVYYSGSTAIRNIDDLTLTTYAPTSVATTTTINVPANFNNDLHNGTSAGTLTATVAAGGTAISDATVTWSSSDTGVATIDANGAVTLVAVGTTTITASYAGVENQYRPSSDTYELTVIDSYAPGTQNNPYTVAQARAAIDANTGITNVYATGIISQVDSYSNNTITYWISDDGTTTNQLEVYKGKNLNNTNFTALTDVEVGATVIVFGTLKKYNDIYEFNSGNYLTSYTAPQHAVEAPTFSPAAGTYASAQSVTISCATANSTIYYTLDGTEPTSSSTQYTSPLAVSSTTTVKAIAYVGTEASNVATATYHFCSAENPYTVTEALAFNEYPANNIYVSGIVSTAPTSLSSGMLTYYISEDGTTTNQLEVYKGKDLNNEAFTAADDIQVGDIVTVYGNVVIYGTTNPIKEFAQGNYLVSFERPTAPAEDYTLTIANPSNVTITADYGTDGVLTNGDSDDIESGTEIAVTVNVASGYVLDALTVTGENNQTVEVTENNGVYTFDMPAFNATVSATVAVATTGTYTLATSITSGKQYIIVGQANGNYYAMGNDKGNNRYAYSITLDGTTATANIASNGVHEFTITSLGEDYYSIMDATTNGGYLYAANSGKNYLKTEATLDENHNGDWKITITDGSFSVVADQSSNRNVMQFNNSDILFACYASASQHPVFLYEKVEIVTYDLTITGYGNDNTATTGWNLIASPVAISPADVENMTSNTYDLYYFDKNQDKEWINYKASDDSHNPGFNLVPGKGYLYANSSTVTLKFTGDLYDGDGQITLEEAGWHLIGNPFYETTTNVGRDFYRMNSNHDGLIAGTAEDNVNPWEGIFVKTTEGGEIVTFAPIQNTQTGDKSAVEMNLSRNNSVVDRAIVRFGNNNTLPKFQLFENSTKLYIAQNGEDYAIVAAEAQGNMPVSFKASENGNYTLSVNTTEVEMSYLHLIDNMTGADIDLLSNPSYTFDAQTDDLEARFRLVFSAKSDNENIDEPFAFVSNGQIILTDGDAFNATLQVIDMMGRVLDTRNGVRTLSTVNMTPGVYVLRLLNGNTTRTQKIVVE